MKALRILTPLIGVIAIVALAAGGLALARKPTSYTPQIKVLRGDVSRTDSEVTGLRADSDAGEVASLKTAVRNLNVTIDLFKTCVPELEQQINGESINSDTQNGYLTDAYINNPTIISTNCSKVLNG